MNCRGERDLHVAGLPFGRNQAGEGGPAGTKPHPGCQTKQLPPRSVRSHLSRSGGATNALRCGEFSSVRSSSKSRSSCDIQVRCSRGSMPARHEQRASTAEAQKRTSGHNQDAPPGMAYPVSLASHDRTSFMSKNRDFTVRISARSSTIPSQVVTNSRSPIRHSVCPSGPSEGVSLTSIRATNDSLDSARRPATVSRRLPRH